MKRTIRSKIVKVIALVLSAAMLLPDLPVQASMDNQGITGPQGSNPVVVDDEAADEAADESEAYVSADWVEDDVTGSDSPTLAAQKPQNFSAYYDAGQKAESNLYTLTISTGIKAGDSVRYIAVRYKDVDGVLQTKYILMSDDPLKEGYDYMKSKGGENTELKKRHDQLSKLNYSINSPENPKPLQPWSIDEYLFKTEKEIKEVTGIDILMGEGSWTVQGLSVSKVVDVAGYGEYGFYSGKYFFGISKKRLCELVKKKSGTLTISAKGDNLFRLAGGSSNYFGLKQVSGEEKVTRPFQDLYSFRMDFADTLQGGLESYLNPTTKDGNPVPSGFVEDLALEVEYKDTNGWTRSVVMPVMLSVLGQYLTSGDSVATMGLAQRGETIAFTGYLPEYSSLISTNLYVGEKARTRLQETGGLTTVKSSSLKNSLDLDEIGLTGVSIYRGTCRLSNTADGIDTKTKSTLKSYTTAFSFSEADPLYYFTATDTAGKKIAANSKVSVTMKNYDNRNPLVAAKPDWNILIRLRTGTPRTAGTSGDVSVRLEYYNAANQDASTALYNARDLCNEYLGYWPSDKGAKGNFAYAYGMNPGSYIEFPVTLDDVAALTSIYVSLGSKADDYQLDAISVCSVDDIGRRRIYRQSVSGEGDSSQFRIVRTNSHGDIAPFPIKFQTPQFFSKGDYRMYDLLEGRTGDVSGRGDTYTDNRYSMTYEQTMEDLGFVQTRKAYDVVVKVADDPESSSVNGDSGSSNQFFFQLVFQNGNSAFVLANQQLTSDGFRAGYQESFTISVNRDYGALRSVRVIPEDIDSKSEIFDKLNVEKITVTEKANGGAAMRYNLDNVGWIGIDYHDSAEAGSIRGREGRFLGEIATTFSVTSYQQVVSLLCEISTLPPQVEAEMCKQVSVACDLNYIDTNDQPQTLSFDIVTLMAEYMKKTPITYEAPTDGSQASYYRNMGTVSDPEWMFRPNHTDRFIIPAISDLKSVKSMVLYGTNRNKDTAKWVIGGVSISEILRDGSLQLTTNDEYYRSLTTAPVCRMTSLSGKEELTLPAGVSQPLTINFTDNELVWKTNESWVTPVTRMPDSEDDTLNVFIYPSASSRNIEGVNLKLAAQYSLPFSQVMQATQNNLKVYGSGTENAMFYMTGLSVKGMERLVSLNLKCMNSKMYFDHAVVQHVREGVVISTDYVPLMEASAVLGLTGKPVGVYESKYKRMQKLYLSLDDSVNEAALFAEENDIAVAFKYRTSIDNNENEYYSPYIYLTDVGYDRIGPGMMLEIPFEISDVTEITGYRIAAFGGIKASASGAIMVNYSYDSRSVDANTSKITYNGKSRKGVYCFNQNAKISNSISEYKCSGTGFTGDNTLNMLDLTFNTASAQPGGESGSDAPVMMTFHYRNHFGAEEALTVPDIRQYIQLERDITSDEDREPVKEFKTGESARVRLFIPECSELLFIEVISMSDWTLESVSGSLSMGDVPINRLVNQSFGADIAGVIGFVDVGLRTTYRYGNEATGYTQGAVEGHNAGIVATSDTTFYVYPTSDRGGVNVKLVWIVNGTETDITSQLLWKDGSYTFAPPPNKDLTARTYSIIITSTWNSSISDRINITVPSDVKFDNLEQVGETEDTSEGSEEETAETSED